MLLGIKPIVDFAFKKIFGSPDGWQALVGLLNAILAPAEPIVEVEILNPFSYQDFLDDKLIVLDIRARDTAGRWLNIEMQLNVVAGLRQRLVYYACSLYTDQLRQGQDYRGLRPAITICLLCDVLFPDTSAAHHRFRLTDVERNRTLAETIEVHTVELTKYNLKEATISRASAVEQWAFFLLCAHRYEVDRLRALLPGDDFQQAISTAEAIKLKSEDRLMYDQREKAQRDYLWAIEGARKEALETGIEQGIELGIEKGELIGKIELLGELLGVDVGSRRDLLERSAEDLSSVLARLQEQLRRRGE